MRLGKVEGGNLSEPQKESYCKTSGLSTMLYKQVCGILSGMRLSHAHPCTLPILYSPLRARLSVDGLPSY